MYRSAKLLLRDSEGSVLLLRRSTTHPWHPHGPDLPGGVIEDGENFRVGLTRELKEETGLMINPIDLVELYEVRDEAVDGARIHRFIFTSQLQVRQPHVTLSWEHDKYDWVHLEEVKGLERANQEGVDVIIKKQLIDKS